MSNLAILGVYPSPPGLRAIYAVYEGKEITTKILPVLNFVRVALPDQIAVGGMSLDPEHPVMLIVCQTHEGFVSYLNPGESNDDVEKRVAEFVASLQSGCCGQCGKKHPKRRRR